jgi:hypothetical protein
MSSGSRFLLEYQASGDQEVVNNIKQVGQVARVTNRYSMEDVDGAS